MGSEQMSPAPTRLTIPFSGEALARFSRAPQPSPNGLRNGAAGASSQRQAHTSGSCGRRGGSQAWPWRRALLTASVAERTCSFS